MRTKISIIAAIILCICPGVVLAGGVETTSSDLINDAGGYDGQEIVYTGEVIGDVLSRGEYAWINVFDGSNAIGIWAKDSDIQEVDTLGSYTAHGDIVKVTGVFNRACAEHGGDMDIHAQSIEVIQGGYAILHGVPVWKVVLGGALLAGAAACMVVLFLRKRNRSIASSHKISDICRSFVKKSVNHTVGRL